ncbi:aconitate hydratase [Pseudobacteroides cellulosolvens]|uniref:Aconitate hydratase n=1 Tax=Pseudobacteroides cellulosolvens ATCC 35603 = DSM 2933 TaxID=398512 RepID=A0A0L6JNX6_9FIRM|nr:aconitate hydratase [Pseudobacteroides cellulosolvens]KNY27072.1 aconitate hydratase [Pseudobacteroides cellulosolvens ATCC 35603 = DSM 2933]
MKGTITEKILKQHLVEGEFSIGNEIAITIDNTLTQDATGTMAYLQFEAIGMDRVKTELSVSFVDHNTLQTDFKNADDHLYLQSVAKRYGLYFSKPGNGICHQLFLERFARPGKTLIGSDSHTPTAGGIGSFAMGAGGLDVAAAMAGAPFRIKFPKVVGVKLTGQLTDWVSAKDVILEVLRRIDVKGGVGKVLEYFGPGVKTLSVPDRATITNMGTETGCTTSIFPSDDVTKAFLEAQGRGDQWVELIPSDDAQYDEIIDIDLSTLEPMIALPHSPGNVKKVREVQGRKVDQVAVGSCTNSSLRDLKMVANALNGKTVNENVSMMVSPGSRQVVEHLVDSGEMKYLVQAGVRMLENSCGPCIGMGSAPCSAGVSVRTFNRNFEGRSGTKDADVYLASPEVAVAAALTGKITDPRDLGECPKISMPEKFFINDNMTLKPLPQEEAAKVEIVRGPNIKPLPTFDKLPDVLEGSALLKVGDNITTDHIMPAGAKILPLRSNIPEISKHVFEAVDENFYKRALESSGGFIIGGENYGQGSSREHAALAPKYLGIKAVIVKSFARIHLANLVNFGIVPLTFKNPGDYDRIELGDKIEIAIGDLKGEVKLKNVTKGFEVELNHTLSALDAEILKVGGKLPWIKESVKK